MRVLLTQRRWRWGEPANNPIALLDLAPVARADSSREVECYFMDDISALRPADWDRDYDLVGLSVLMEYPGVMEDVQALRDRFPRSRLVVGGKWTRGLDGEELGRLEDLGVTVWSGAGEEYFGQRAWAEQPSWDARDLETLRVSEGGLMSSRGCPYHCAFCNNTEKKVTLFSPERTADNLALLLARGIKKVFFVDDVFTANVGHMRAIHEECVRRGIPLAGRSMFFTHVNYVNAESVEAMRLFEPYCVQIGIESGDDVVLAAMRKGFTAQRAYERVKLLGSQVPLTALFLIGFPGETEASLRNTVEFVRAAAPYLTHVWVSYYQPVPGTKGYALAQQRGRITKPGLRNTQIGYVDDALSRSILIKYRHSIYKTWKWVRS